MSEGWGRGGEKSTSVLSQSKITNEVGEDDSNMDEDSILCL